jgi:RNA polymerase-binding transcription factor DksA
MPLPSELRQRLEQERNRLLVEIAAIAKVPADLRPTRDSYYGNHLADTATDTFEDEKALALEAHLTGLLSQVDEALARAANGTYGLCSQCGQPIAPERLEALPYATTCVSCSVPLNRARAAGRPR